MILMNTEMYDHDKGCGYLVDGEIEMHDSQLTLQFENGSRLVLMNRAQHASTFVEGARGLMGIFH